MYIGKPQRVFTVEPVEHPVQRKDAERRSERGASVSVVDVGRGACLRSCGSAATSRASEPEARRLPAA
jgi:hypothetical protein